MNVALRVERTGKIEPLTPRLIRFMVEALGGRSLDALQAANERKIDYACLNGLLAVEVKTLEEDASARMKNLTDQLRQRDDWPVFLGSAPMQSFIKNMKDPDGLQLAVLDRIGRAIINHLKKANKQLESHVTRFPRKNLVRILLLINEDHPEYDPHTVSYIIWHAVRRRQGDKPLYAHIDSVIYMSERHASVVDGLVAFPILITESPVIDGASWKGTVFDRFVRGWADWNNNPLHEATDLAGFATIDHIPDVAPRHERWRTDYRRRPYMRSWSDEQVRDLFDDVMVMSTLFGIKGSPLKLPQGVMKLNMESFTHIMLEMAERALPISAFSFSPDRHVAAARRMNLPENVIDWLKGLHQESKRRTQ